jgi:5-methylcytosine-specific restriction endonuclease McrA
MSKFSALGISDLEYSMLEQKLEEESKAEIIQLRRRGYESWGDYIKFDIDETRRYNVGGGYFMSWERQLNHHTVRTKRREEYYTSSTWALRRNDVLDSAKYICAGCGGVATQAHHQASSIKHGNYVHIGDPDEHKESEDLVPVCGHCHIIVTNIQNTKRHIKTPRTLELKLSPYRMPVVATLNAFDDIEPF